MTAWLIQIIPDPRRAEVRRDLADVVLLHKRVMSLVPDDLGADARALAGLLFRVEQTRTGPRLLVQSRLRPDPTRLPAGYGRSACRPLEPLLDRLRPGMAVRYRLTANAAKRAGRTAQQPGKIIPLRGGAADDWWADRAGRVGLTLRTLTASAFDDVTGRQPTKEGNARIRHALTRYDGVGVVTDPDTLRQAILDGVGRGKPYGAGLLSIAPIGTAA